MSQIGRFGYGEPDNDDAPGARFGRAAVLSSALQPAEARAAAAFRRRRWRLRSMVQDLALEARGGGEAPEAGGVVQVSGRADAASFTLFVPDMLADALLSRAPEPVALAGLAAEDAGLLLEHVMTPLVEALEAASHRVIRLEAVAPAPEGFGSNGVSFTIAVQGRALPARFQTDDPALYDLLSEKIAALDVAGPSALAGMDVAIGPVMLSREDIAQIAAGDELLLEGASIERLSGAVMLDETLHWPIALVDGAIVVEGALREMGAGADGPVPVFFLVGVTAEASTMKSGDRLGLQRVEERRMVLKAGAETLGRAGLVNTSDGLMLRFFGKDGV